LATVPIAVVTFQFDPSAHLFGDLTVRWSAIALAAVIVAALLLAGQLARNGGLRPDDVAFVAVGIVPGAVLGGRLGYLLLHLDYYGSALGSLLDPSVGGLELGLGVVGGFLTGCYVASLLGASLGRWLHLAAAPVLFMLGAGKLTMILGGSGQGTPSDAPWATAYLGQGPWGSLVPALPSQPSQAFEGIAGLAILAILALALRFGAFRRRDGRLFFVAIGSWAIARAAVSTTWRDPVVDGGLRAGAIIAIAIATGCLVAFVIITILRNEGSSDERPARAAIDWPDPATPPKF